MNFWHLIWLIVICWLLGSVWLSLYLAHRIKMADYDQLALSKEYEIEKLKSDFRKS
jgi:hypothetical protein